MHRVKKGAKILSLAIVVASISFIVAAAFLPDALLEREDVPKSCASVVLRIAQYPIKTTKGEYRDNCMIRDWYYRQLKRIPVMDSQLNVPLSERAFCAFAVHHQSRMMVRKQMNSTYQRMVQRLQDFYIYSNFNGPDFDHLLQGEIHIQLTDYYERLIKKSQASDKAIDNMCQKNL